MRSSSRAGAHAFVADLATPELAAEDVHHLERVLRLRPGEPVSVSDGAGGWRRCVWAGGGRLDPAGDVRREERPSPPVTVAFGLTKGERPEWVVQKLTEVGVDRIVPVAAARSVVRWEPDRTARNLERLRRVAREAAMQSRQVWLPSVTAPVPFAEAATLPGAALAQPGGAPPALSRPALLVGPEGGWSPEELAYDLPVVSLGRTVLRAETAAVAAGILLCALRNDLVRTAESSTFPPRTT